MLSEILLRVLLCAVLSRHAYSKPYHLPLFSLFERHENVKHLGDVTSGSKRGVYRLEFSSVSFQHFV